MMLNKKTYATITNENVDALFALPEKVVQFGTGVLLRGLPDYFIDKANKQGLFNGRIVVVKSTDQGGTDAYAAQDGLYTILEKGIENGLPIERTTINASISRVVSAKTEWQSVLDCAANPDIQIVISNTTEVGITLVASDANSLLPESFPGKLLHFLIERYRVFNGSLESGLVIIPTELISDNGIKLKEIVIELAQLKGLDEAFINWVYTANDFCSSLVDCIVPGKLPANEQAQFEQKVGYQDSLAIMSEPYRLWAIETSSEKTAAILSFAAADARVILAPSINKYKEIKLRLLLQVVDRFSNQSIEHLWVNIAVQYTAKMQMRVVPLVDKYVKRYSKVPTLISFGFAAFLLFMKSKNDPGAIDALASKTTMVASDVFNRQVFDCIDKIEASSIKNVLVSLLNK